MAKYGIIVDLDRCTGCMTCVIACKQENLTRPGVWWNKILELESEALDRIIYLRHACMHCEDPPCLTGVLHDAAVDQTNVVFVWAQDRLGLIGRHCPHRPQKMCRGRRLCRSLSVRGHQYQSRNGLFSRSEAALRKRKGIPPPAPAGQSRHLHSLCPSYRSRTNACLYCRMPLKSHDFWGPR